MFGRGGVAGDAITTSEKVQAGSWAKTGDWSTGCLSSSGEEDKMCKSQEAEIEELREQVEWFRKQRGEAEQEGQSDPARGESGLEDD